MQTLKRMLQENDEAFLRLVAVRWGVDERPLNRDALIDALNAAMLTPEIAERIFDSLSDEERGVLQALVGAKRTMPVQMFELLYGALRLPSAGIITRERPHEKPQSPAESLLYRGLIGRRVDEAGVGIGYVMYIPDDLADVLPLHKTGYSAAALDPDGKAAASMAGAAPTFDARIETLSADEVDDVQHADTSIVDDMTTVLAFLRVNTCQYDRYQAIDDASIEHLLPHLLVDDLARVTFMIEVAITAGLIEVSNGRLSPRREASQWLEQTRSTQLKVLVDAWLRSNEFRELSRTPGLLVEEAASYDPAAARRSLLETLREHAPRAEWWSVDSFIELMHAKNPSFQRPGADFDSWYIRNDEDEYLNGFENWYAVEGAVLEFYLNSPLHWLGLLDLAEYAARLNGYGRALLENRWVEQSDPPESIHIDADGSITATRKTSRYARFQLARFTSWVSPATRDGDPYVYKLDGAGIKRGAEQGINTDAIAKFLGRVSADDTPLPPAVTQLLSSWVDGAAASVTLEQHLILRSTSKAVIDALWDNPAIRRYFGARLGDTDVIVRAEYWQALTEALNANGVDVDSRLDAG